MTRLIDADILKADVKRQVDMCVRLGMGEFAEILGDSLYKEIDKQPTVDAVNVITDAIKEMYEEESRSVESVDLIPLPFKTWLQRTTLRDFSEYLQEKKGND